jgi:myo-inositol-1(or 4)-monophosphatase
VTDPAPAEEDSSTLDADLRDLALAAAHLGAHAILRELRRGDLRVETKAHPADFVTTADQAAEAAILGLVRSARPNDAVLAEESGERAGTTGVRWVVDPLDGTMNFVHGRRDYAVSVGVERDGEIVAGAIVRPADGDWAAAGGGEAVARDATPRISVAADLSDALVGVGLPSPMEQRLRVHGLIGELMRKARDYRRSGSSACDLLSVALGEQDGYLGFGVHLWDVAAGMALVHEAGGTAQWLTTASGIDVLIAGTPSVTEALVDLAKVV